MNKIKNPVNKGFTLIEIIISMVILAIVGVFAGMWLMTMIEGYTLTRTNADTIQNAEIILARLTKELSSTTSITEGNKTSLTFLANKISSFNLKYHSAYDDTGVDTYSKASTALITITLSLIGAESTNFEERVYLHGIMTGT